MINSGEQKMNKTTIRKVTGILFITVCMILGGISGNVLSSGKDPYADRPSEPLLHKKFDGWTISIDQPDFNGVATSRVDFKLKTLADVEKYRKTNKDIAGTLKSSNANLSATVTLNKAKTIPEFNSWVAIHKLSVENFQIRALDDKGNRWTIGGDTEAGVVSDVNATRILEKLKSNGLQKPIGIFAFEASLQANQYDSLISDGDVFLVDITKAQIQAEASRIGGAKLSKLNMLVPNAYEFVENGTMIGTLK